MCVRFVRLLLDDEGGRCRSERSTLTLLVLPTFLSGTQPSRSHISECFNHTIPVLKTLTRYKHWFQYPDDSKYPHDTLVLAQFRNPYEWLKAMEHVPHHSPAHLRTNGASTDEKAANNDWKIFLTKPWTTNRTGADLLLHGNETCQEDFKYRDIVSCVLEPIPHEAYNYTIRYSEHQPFYEMRNDGSGLPYDSIMEMRTDKIRNFLTVANYKGVADLWVLQYEYLVLKGTQHLLDRIEEWTGITAQVRGQTAASAQAQAIACDHSGSGAVHSATLELDGGSVDWVRARAESGGNAGRVAAVTAAYYYGS